VHALWTEWALNPNYEHGFLVPLLTAYLIYARLRDLPEAAPANSSQWISIGLWATLPCWLLIEVVRIANPDWRMLFWGAGILTYGAISVIIWSRGGLKWVAHFAPALALLFFAIPWGFKFESELTQFLMRMVAAVTVELMNLFGIYAEQRGNLIQLNGAIVGVEEACSGVRSFQSTLMAAWFIGELFRYPAFLRGLLLITGAVVSFGLNLIRTTSLTWITQSKGSDHMVFIHDAFGSFISIIAFGLLLALALLLNRYVALVAPQAQTVSDSRNPFFRQSTFPSRIQIISLLAGFMAILILPPFWYRLQQPERNRAIPHYSIDWNRIAPEVQIKPISPEIQNQLRYNEGTHAEWTDRMTGQKRILFFFRWEAGRISSFAGVHRPDTCLPASGFVQNAQLPEFVYTQNGRIIHFDVRQFTDFNQQPFTVFFAVWDEDPNRPIALVQSSIDRLKAAWKGQYIQSRCSLEAIFFGPASPQLKMEFKKLLDANLLQQ
jgi:exosortase